MSSKPRVTLEAIKYVSQRTKDIVKGYVKKVENMMPSNSSFFNIPSLVSHWIMLYYYLREYFEYNGDKIKLNPSGSYAKTIAKYVYEEEDKFFVHGHNIIDKGSCHSEWIWEIKLIKFAKIECSIEIGLDDFSNDNIFHRNSYYFAEDGTTRNCGWYLDNKGAKKWQDGDIIKIKLNIVTDKDVKTGTLKSFINDVSTGIVFRHIDINNMEFNETGYRLSIRIPSLNDQVELISLMQIKLCKCRHNLRPGMILKL